MATAEFSVQDLQVALEHAGDDLKREVAVAARAAAESTASQVSSTYHLGPTGTLRARVFARAGTKKQVEAVATALTWITRATAPHVHIYEEGTKPRYDATRANAYRGRSPKLGPVFIPVAMAHRSRMLARAEQMIAAHHEL